MDDNGVIFAKSPGTCVIKVQSSTSDIRAEYSVTVVEKTEEEGHEDPGKQNDPGKKPTPASPTPKGQKTQTPTPASPTPKGQKTQQQATGQKESQQQTGARDSSNGKNTGSGTKSGAVNTGDNSKPSVWLLLIVCSAFIIRRTLWRSVERNRDK